MKCQKCGGWLVMAEEPVCMMCGDRPFGYRVLAGDTKGGTPTNHDVYIKHKAERAKMKRAAEGK